VLVIVIIVILAARAMPQYVDLAPCTRCVVAQTTCAAVQSQAVLLYASTRAPSSFASIASALNTNHPAVTATSCSAFSAIPPGGSPITCDITLSPALCQ
jgi:hypothetical protein